MRERMESDCADPRRRGRGLVERCVRSWLGLLGPGDALHEIPSQEHRCVWIAFQEGAERSLVIGLEYASASHRCLTNGGSHLRRAIVDVTRDEDSARGRRQVMFYDEAGNVFEVVKKLLDERGGRVVQMQLHTTVKGRTFMAVVVEIDVEENES